MQVNFITQTRLSIIDITSMGDSVKRNDPNTIGTFDSGLKFAIALLLRDCVGIDIKVYNEGIYDDTTFKFNTYNQTCDKTGKNKELISVVENGKKEIKTGFAKALGFNWELWMSLRELFSNMLDENGLYSEGDYDGGYGTLITLTFDENNEFFEVWKNRHLYINEKPALYKITNNIEVLENKENTLRIYKQNILVYKDETIKSKFAYNVKYGEIDERRILSNVYSVKTSIVSAIVSTDNESYLREIITPMVQFDDKEFLNDMDHYGTASEEAHKIAQEVHEEYGDLHSYGWLMKAIKERKDCKIPGKIIRTIQDSLWTYSDKVSVESKPEIKVEEKENTLQEQINKHYNFTLDVEVKTAKLKGSKVVADKYDKCLIIDKEFNVKDDMPEFIVQYLDLTQQGNVIKNLSVYICNLIKK